MARESGKGKGNGSKGKCETLLEVMDFPDLIWEWKTGAARSCLTPDWMVSSLNCLPRSPCPTAPPHGCSAVAGQQKIIKRRTYARTSSVRLSEV